MLYSKLLMSRLNDIIGDVSTNSDFIRNPNSDFTRSRKLDFRITFNTILTMGGTSLNRELINLFNFSDDTPTKSAFVQARDKILPHAFSHVFYEFSKKLRRPKSFKGFKLLAVDGSSVITNKNASDSDSYVIRNSFTMYNEHIISAMYDLMNNVYTDAVVQPVYQKNERGALISMIPNVSDKSIIITDRGYESYNVMAHIENANQKYIIRVKDIDSNGMAAGFGFTEEEFDYTITINISNFQKKKYKELSNYRFSPTVARFDFSDELNPVYSLTFRVVRIRLNDGKYQCLVTNLFDDFSINDFKRLYAMRWGIETSFRELKYAVGLNNFHSKKKDSIIQEIYASLTLHNFCESIVQNTILTTHATKHFYKIDFVMAVETCRQYLRLFNTILINVEASIIRYLSVIRNGRSFFRNLKSKSYTSFVYRIS